MSKSEKWPANHGRFKMYLEPSNRIYYRKINNNGNPESFGTGNAGKECIAILGVKDIEGRQNVGEFRGRNEYSGLSMDILKDDYSIFLCD